MKISAIALFASLTTALPTKGKYEGDQVFRLNFQNDTEKSIFESLLDNYDLKLDVWGKTKDQVEVRVPFASLDEFTESIKPIKSEVFIDNVQKLVDSENVITNKAAPAIYASYQSSDALFEYIRALPGITEFKIGKTYLGSPIRGVRFGTGSKNVVFNGGIHAREWISPATVTYLTEFLTSDDPKAIKLRNTFTFHVVPVLNIDVS